MFIEVIYESIKNLHLFFKENWRQCPHECLQVQRICTKKVFHEHVSINSEQYDKIPSDKVPSAASSSNSSHGNNSGGKNLTQNNHYISTFIHPFSVTQSQCSVIRASSIWLCAAVYSRQAWVKICLSLLLVYSIFFLYMYTHVHNSCLPLKPEVFTKNN